MVDRATLPDPADLPPTLRPLLECSNVTDTSNAQVGDLGVRDLAVETREPNP